MFNERDFDSRNRQIVLEGRNILERTGESIERSNQIAQETEDIGNEVLAELGGQREALLRTRERLEGANATLDNTRNILKKMGRNVLYNKLILILIIVLEVAILLSLSYLKFIKK